MNIEQQNRIIELAFQWQQKNEWTAASKAAENFRHHREQASKDRVVIRRMQEGKTPTGQLDLFQHSATRNEELSEMYHAQVIDAHKDFCELVNLLRTNAPALLEYVPTVDFFSDNSSADYSPQIRDLKKLEGAVRAEYCSPVSPDEPPIPPAEILPFGLQKCDVANWLRRQGFDDPVEIKEVYAKAMDAFIAAAPHAISKQKREHLKATGCDVRNAPKELRKILDNIGLTIKNWTLKELEN